jgi:hypothetical protein
MKPVRHVSGGDIAIRATDIPLPAWRHVPGRNERHGDDAFAHVKSLCPVRTESATAEGNIAWRYGLRLFNEAYYWETHEVLETVWLRARPNSRERWLVQCVIHLANGALKQSAGRRQAAVRLAGLADTCRQRAYAGPALPVMGLGEATVAANCQRLRAGDAVVDLNPIYMQDNA